MSWEEKRDAVRREYANYLEAVEATKDREDSGVHPHCDDLILHAPGKCWACDLYPKRQQLRLDLLIAFTGEGWEHTNLRPCPAEASRPLEKIERWGGNVARTTEQQAEADAAWADLVAKWPGVLP